ncbi:MAG: esterase/lipase family protein [Gemmatimonadales bacterium]
MPRTPRLIRCLTVALAMPAALPAQPRPISVRPVNTGNCAAAVATWWRNLGVGGRISCGADPTRPAVLLVHGLHRDARTWTAPSYVEYSYDYRGTPAAKTVSGPNAGILKVGASDWLYGADRAGWDAATNWFDFLVAQGYTVATWSQPGLTFAEAVPSALAAFDSLVSNTRARSPAAPPPVALIGHSRGGLLMRRILKDKGSAGRVKWFVTLHSPHGGSDLGRWPGRLAAEATGLASCCLPAWLAGPFKQAAGDLITEAMRPITKLAMDDESRELIPDGPLLRDLAAGERALPDVKYYTFGGVNPRMFRVYAWTFGAPVVNAGSVTTKATPREIDGASPILDALRDFADELTPGKGDALVSDQRSRLPWSIHTTDQLNHAEVLWDRPLQQRVVQLISPPVRTATVPLKP